MADEPSISTQHTEPPARYPVTNGELGLIYDGLCIPNAETIRAMAYELKEWRGNPNPGTA